ncbi:MAG: KpsF/GutQ family sugar-phosphate isomerase [Elusimicrobia bacterium]|nr:KpsF/GutQ family sugar-phosphate isomerase [Elusimicrobiota bacterium]
MKRLDVVRELKAVIGMEAEALRKARDAVNGRFSRAVTLLSRCRGKVVVTGMGKSGLIGQKVAATLAATGTPAISLHPAEGMHGDLGVVQRTDVILAIGKSGESDELNAILPSLRRIGAPIIAITSNPRSTLAKRSDIVLVTPIDGEACPLNLSPTCSTTAALAVGDALAVTLMKLRGLSKEQFAALHPGGRLGKRLTLLVADIMRDGDHNPVIGLGATMQEALVEMTRQHAGAVSVVDRRGRLKGLVTDYDIRRQLERGENILKKSVREVMNAKPTSIRSDSLAIVAADVMGNRKFPFTVLPVVDGRGRAIGMINLVDIRARGL